MSSKPSQADHGGFPGAGGRVCNARMVSAKFTVFRKITCPGVSCSHGTKPCISSFKSSVAHCPHGLYRSSTQSARDKMLGFDFIGLRCCSGYWHLFEFALDVQVADAFTCE